MIIVCLYPISYDGACCRRHLSPDRGLLTASGSAQQNIAFPKTVVSLSSCCLSSPLRTCLRHNVLAFTRVEQHRLRFRTLLDQGCSYSCCLATAALSRWTPVDVTLRTSPSWYRIDHPGQGGISARIVACLKVSRKARYSGCIKEDHARAARLNGDRPPVEPRGVTNPFRGPSQTGSPYRHHRRTVPASSLPLLAAHCSQLCQFSTHLFPHD